MLTKPLDDSPGAARRDAVDRQLGPVHEIVVFRALGLGDLICATPALAMLKQRFPAARLTLVGLPWAAELAHRLDSVDAFIPFPGHPSLPERHPDEAAWPVFLERVRSRCFDLAVQLHGNGRLTNGIVGAWGARHVAAFHEAHRPPPEDGLGVIWPTTGSEVSRLLSLIDVLGPPAPSAQVDGQARWHLSFPVRDEDDTQARALLAAHGLMPQQPYACVHAGSQWASRRWPVAHFAEVARALHERGLRLVLTGVAGEQALGQRLQEALPEGSCANLLGQTNLWTMGALIRRAHLLVCNDTGVSHVAAALGTPSVVVSCGADVSRWAPADAARHPVLWADAPCRPCEQPECPTAHECAQAVSPAQVLDAAQTLLASRA